MSFLRKFTILQRLAMLCGLVILGLLTLSLTSLKQTYDALEQEQYIKTEQLVESTSGIILYFYNLQQKGMLREEQAKQQAAAAIESVRYDGDNYFWITDLQPTMIMHPLKPSLNGTSVADIKDPNGVTLFSEMVKIAKTKGAGFVPYQWPKPGLQKPADKISYVKYFSPWQWVLGSGVYLDTIEHSFSSVRNWLIIDAVISAIVVCFLSYIIANSILKPTRTAANLMKDVSQGEGDLTQKLDQNGQDEISRLSRYFNMFTDKMCQSLKEVAHNSNTVLNHAKSVSQATTRNHEFIQIQNENSSQVAAAMLEMTEQIREVGSSAGAAEKAANDAKTNTELGRRIVSKTIDEIEALSEDITSVSQTIISLAQETENIGTVLDVIRSIADQTNLLALNAAIEAARAGEQGRGFAVVADEVRTLASRTGKSTEEIQVMIQKLQSGAQKAVEAVKSSQARSSATVEQAAQADQALTEIARLISIISQMNSDIAQATLQQNQTADNVNARICELTEMTAKSLENTELLGQAGKELSASSHDMAKVVQRFKLG